MKFIETNKHRQIEEATMELAMSWYYRYKEKKEQMDKIDKQLREFEEWMFTIGDDNVAVAELQKAWNKQFTI